MSTIHRICGLGAIWLSFAILHVLPTTQKGDTYPAMNCVLGVFGLFMFVFGIMLFRGEDAQ